MVGGCGHLDGNERAVGASCRDGLRQLSVALVYCSESLGSFSWSFPFRLTKFTVNIVKKIRLRT